MLASGGYPEHYAQGYPISGLDEAGKMPETVVFHAGTKISDGSVVTAGGRVLGVTAVGKDIADAQERAYKAVSVISFKDMQYRKDIAWRALKK